MDLPVYQDLRGHGFTPQGGVQLSTSQHKFGGSSLFTGTSGSSWITTPHAADLDVGSGDYTVEGWFYPTAAGDRTVFIKGLNSAAGLSLFVSTDKVIHRSALGTDLSAAVTLSGWTHVAWVRAAGAVTIYVNGTAVAAGTRAHNHTDGGVLDLGASAQNASDTYRYYGYLDAFRMTNGVARYTGNFAPPTEPFPADSSDPSWGSVVLLMPMEWLVVPPVFTVRAVPWRLQAVLPEHYTLRTRCLAGRAWSLRDQWWGGMGKITGTTKIKGNPNFPVSRRVRLLDLKTGLIVRETWSDTNGNYQFLGLDPTREYVVLAHDHTRNYNAVIADHLAPEPMP